MRATGPRHGKWKGGITRNLDGYIQITAGVHRGKYGHRLYMERLLGRPLRPDEEIEHLCRTRDCWPPSDFHLCLMPAALHDAVSVTNSRVKRKWRQAPIRPLFPEVPQV